MSCDLSRVDADASTCSVRRRAAAALVAVVAAASVLVLSPAAAAQTGGADLASVDVTRYGGADRYATSLLVAEAFADDAGGRLDHVVMVSGRHWYDAVVAAGFAGHVEAPVLMTPPDAVRDDVLEFLERVGASQVTVVSTGVGFDATVSPQVFATLREAGITVYRLGGEDRYGTGVSVAEWMTTAQSQLVSGKIAIIANGEVFADALVAGPLSARKLVPVLLSSKDELHPDVAEFLSDADIERVVLMGGTAALSETVETAVTEMGIAVDRMAGATRFETAVLTGQFAADHVGGGCFAGTHVGLARARVPFDSFSAAPLLARLCAPLVLTDPKKIPASTAAFLDDVRRSSQDEKIELTVFGGDAAVSQAALDAYLAADESTEEATAEDIDLPEIAFVRRSLRVDASGLGFETAIMVMNSDGTNQRLLSQGGGGQQPQYDSGPDWSPDGTEVAFNRRIGRDRFIVVADVTTGAQERLHPSSGNRDLAAESDPDYSPDGSKIAFTTAYWPGASPSEIAVSDTDGDNTRLLTSSTDPLKPVLRTRPVWSPDGTKIAYHCNFNATVDANGLLQVNGGYNICVIDADGSNEQRVSSSPIATPYCFNWVGEHDLTGRWGRIKWSPDGRYLRWVECVNERHQGISFRPWQTDLFGSRPDTEHQDGNWINGERLSPDKRHLVYAGTTSAAPDTQGRRHVLKEIFAGPLQPPDYHTIDRDNVEQLIRPPNAGQSTYYHYSPIWTSRLN